MRPAESRTTPHRSQAATRRITLDRNARKTRRLHAAANRVEMAAKLGVLEQQPQDNADRQHDEDQDLETPNTEPWPITRNSSGMPVMIVLEFEMPSMAKPVMIDPVASVAINAEIPR